jgi:hypothetical protein
MPDRVHLDFDCTFVRQLRLRGGKGFILGANAVGQPKSAQGLVKLVRIL